MSKEGQGTEEIQSLIDQLDSDARDMRERRASLTKDLRITKAAIGIRASRKESATDLQAEARNIEDQITADDLGLKQLAVDRIALEKKHREARVREARAYADLCRERAATALAELQTEFNTFVSQFRVRATEALATFHNEEQATLAANDLEGKRRPEVIQSCYDLPRTMRVLLDALEQNRSIADSEALIAARLH